MSCITCGKTNSLHSAKLFVMEWSDNVQLGFKEVKQSRLCGAVQIDICESCLNQALEKKTKGFLVSKKLKESVATAISSKNYSEYINEIAAVAIKSIIDSPNAGKSKAFTAWASANAADHLLNETFIPAECVLACLVQQDNGEPKFVAHEPIRYLLNKPSQFKFIQFNHGKNAFELVRGEQWIEPEQLMALDKVLRACEDFLQM